MFETGNLLDLQFEQVSCFVLSDLQLVLDADITQTIPRRSKLKALANCHVLVKIMAQDA